jgi:predicted GIY-YIG superfamily endonuclease
MLLEYAKGIPPASILKSAIDVYTKCISFRSENTKQIVPILTERARYRTDIRMVKKDCVIEGGRCIKIALCINHELVGSFLREFWAWINKVSDLWIKISNAKGAFFNNSSSYFTKFWDLTKDVDYIWCNGRKLSFVSEWSGVVGNIDRMRCVADDFDQLLQGARSLHEEGLRLVAHHDALLSLEYAQNASEMSLYERAPEIERTCCADDASDEQYCYVYTLECPIGVFYVGIAADPQKRYEQHVRGAYSDEAHLFKSKIIRKYREGVRQKMIYEGMRRECKLREKTFIAEHNPLGNMTAGGEG